MGKDIREALHLLASDKTGAEWDVVVIAEGKSLNGTTYPEDTLRAAVKMFEGVPVCAYQFSDPEVPFDHLPDDVREQTKGESPILNAVGTIEGCRYGEYIDKTTGQRKHGILARLKIGEGFARLRAWMKDAWDSGLNAFGFSIDGAGDVSSDGTVSRLESISELTLVTRPAAGGSGVRLVASQTEDLTMRDKILALLREHAPDLLKDCDVADLKESDVLDLLGKAVSVAKVAAKEEAPPAAPAAAPPPSIDAMLANMSPEELKALAEKLAAMLMQGEEAPAEAAVAASVTEALGKVNAKIADIESAASIAAALDGSKLEDISKARVRESFAGKTPTSDEVASAIKAEAEYVDKLTESGKVAGMGVEVGTERKDRLRLAMELSFGNRLVEADHKIVSDQGIRPFITISDMIEQMEGGKTLRSVREAYAIKGRRLHEGLVTGDWTDIFRDALNKSFIAEYQRLDSYSIDSLKKVARFTPIQNLHTQYAIISGGFANLGAVSQGQTYPEISMYGDLAETYTPSKYGGVVEITEETIKQNDLGELTNIPKKLGFAARRTLYEFGFDMFTTNAAFAQDAVAWFHSNHGGNLLTAAVTQATILAASLVIRKQAEDDSSKRLGLLGNVILCPLDLEGTIKALVRAEGETDHESHLTDPSLIRQLPQGSTWDVVPVTHWTDVNDWYLVCDTSVAETIRIGFVDGKEEPEIWIQDDPKFGARFSADKIQYKIRHWYGGAPVDYRTAVRHTVT